ncbi:major facilitator superfamily domain-containing protein [Phascolomyces articulosus]|uniref:Major facilitator superfamily domain-containing protein n=1 Tax=Phascolomyces articulosus TaxID=60185 RepID=A0AAD5K3I6_9FUNG|nr:major facilitator superfamily domain-containing protein [Phascolomyces articulosus]
MVQPRYDGDTIENNDSGHVILINQEEKNDLEKNIDYHPSFTNHEMHHHQRHVEDQQQQDEIVVDRGYAWLVTIGGTAASSFNGLPTIWGVIQDIYIKDGLFSGSNIAMQLTLIGSLLQALLIACVIISNIFYKRLGPRGLTFLGTILNFSGFMLTAQATSIWHLYLSLSITVGLGIAFSYGATLRCTPQWFIQKRSTSFGIQGSVPSLLCLVLPLVVTQVSNTLGHPWIFRVLGFISLGTGVIAIVFLKDQPSTKNKHRSIPLDSTKNLNNNNNNFDLDVLKNPNMLLWVCGSPLSVSARYLAFVFVPLYATHIGLSGTQAASTVSIMAGSEFFGRIILGVIADRIGPLNTYIGSTVACSLAVFVIWMFAYQFTSLVGFSIVSGFFGGAYTILFPSITSTIVDCSQYPSALNVIMLANLLTIVLPLIASSFGTKDNDGASGNDPFLIYKITAGGLFGVCTILSSIVKFRMNRRIFIKI